MSGQPSWGLCHQQPWFLDEGRCEHSHPTFVRGDIPRLYRTVLNGLLGVETAHLYNQHPHCDNVFCSDALVPRPVQNIRSLLSGEALEDDLGLGVNAQVLDGLGVGRAGRAVATAGSVAQRRRARGGSGDGLHGCEGGEGKREESF